MNIRVSKVRSTNHPIVELNFYMLLYNICVLLFLIFLLYVKQIGHLGVNRTIV